MVIPILKYVRGEHLSPDHWLDLFRLLGLPRGTSLEKLLFGDLLRLADTIVAKASDLKVRITFINILHIRPFLACDFALYLVI